VKSQAKRLFQDWFEVWEAEPGLHVIAEPFHHEDVKSYLIAGRDRAVLVDTGMGVGDIRQVVEALTSLPLSVLNSHSHWDHIGGNWRFSGGEIAIHRLEAEGLEHPSSPERVASFFTPESLSRPLPPETDPDHARIRPTKATRLLDGGETIDLGDRRLEIIHAPGHSPGGIVVVDRDSKLMLTTDVVYEAPLYAHLVGSNIADYLTTLALLEREAAWMERLYPSHNRTPIEPGLVAEARVALEAIVAGRPPDVVEGDRATHRFGAFSFYVRADDPALRGGA
jgi:glyoxylase-like metal-dependent hydrolase (beta-lactamase superfamily II)